VKKAEKDEGNRPLKGQRATTKSSLGLWGKKKEKTSEVQKNFLVGGGKVERGRGKTSLTNLKNSESGRFLRRVGRVTSS